MSSVPTHSTTSPDESIHSSSSSTHHQPPPAQNTVVPTLFDDLFSDLPRDFDSESLNPGVDAPLAPPFQVPLHPINGGPQYHIPLGTPPTATFHALPQTTMMPPAILPGILHPLTFGTFDGAYPLYLFTYLNTAPVPLLSSPGAAVVDPGDRAPLRNTMNPSIPMVSLAAPLMAPAAAPSWSVTRVNPEVERAPVSELRMGVPAGMPAVASGNTNATSTVPVTAGGPAAAAAGTAAAAFVGAGEVRAPVSRCSCCHRVNPLIRIDDTIEWVRPGVMKMVVWFNWTSNAEAEARQSWEPQAREA